MRQAKSMNAELEKLVEQITDQIVARLKSERGHDSNGVDCAECSPHTLACALNAGASRIGLAWGRRDAASAEVARYIDHTLLKPEATREEIEKLCQEARAFNFASVCVNPTWVKECAYALHGSPVKVCAVVGFPLGATLADVKAYETRRAIFDGANEIDMVINIGALKSGDLRTVERDIEAVIDPCRQCGVTSKVIIEAALLSDEEKITACTLSKAAG